MWSLLSTFPTSYSTTNIVILLVLLVFARSNVRVDNAEETKRTLATDRNKRHHVGDWVDGL